LKNGLRANGFPTELWALARVSDVIEKVTGVRYWTAQTWEISYGTACQALASPAQQPIRGVAGQGLVGPREPSRSNWPGATSKPKNSPTSAPALSVNPT